MTDLSPEGLSNYRKQVAAELEDLSFAAVIRMAREATGLDASRFPNRHIAIRAIADHRLAATPK